MRKQKGGAYKGKKRQRGGVYKGSKRQRGGNLAKKTTNKILNEFAKAKTYITNMARKGVSKANKKLNQSGGIVGYDRPMFWGNRLGRNIDKYYL